MEIEVEEEFLSADDEDDFFDLPQDLGLESTGRRTVESPVSGVGFESDLDLESVNEAVEPPGFAAVDPPGIESEQRESCSTQWNLRNDGNVEVLEPIMEKLKLTRDNVKLSKSLSYLLRHAAHKLDVDIRKDGFVRVKCIMNLKSFRPYTLEELMAVVFFDKKERYTMVREYDGELLVRANQGHTLKIVDDVMLLTKIEDPCEVTDVVHGSYLVHWPFIRTQGLSKVARNHIHLANGVPEDGKIRGMRSSAELFVYVDIKAAMMDGIVFFRSKNDVILTQGDEGWLPTKFFVKAVRIDYAALEEVDMIYETNDRPPWPAELAPTGPGTGGTYAVKNLESLIMKCKHRFHELSAEQSQLQGQELEACDNEMENLHLELLSLEQRLRQHKGIGRLSKTERQDREKDNLEQETLIQRMDRAATPPWAKKPDEPRHGISQKEKDEWAVIGRMREDGKSASPEDKWSALRKKDEPSTSSVNDDSEWNLVAPKKTRDREKEREKEEKQVESHRESVLSTSQSSSAPGVRNLVPAASGNWRDKLKEKQNTLQPAKSKRGWGPASDAEGDMETETPLSEQPRAAAPAQPQSPQQAPIQPQSPQQAPIQPQAPQQAPAQPQSPIQPAIPICEPDRKPDDSSLDQKVESTSSIVMPTPVPSTPPLQPVAQPSERNFDLPSPNMAYSEMVNTPVQQPLGMKVGSPQIYMQFDQQFGGNDDRGFSQPVVCFWNGAYFVDASGMPMQMPFQDQNSTPLQQQIMMQQNGVQGSPPSMNMAYATHNQMHPNAMHPSMKMAPHIDQQFGKDDRGKNYNGKGKKMDMYALNSWQGQNSRKGGRQDRGGKGQGKAKSARSSGNAEDPRGDDAWAAIGRVRQEYSATSVDPRNAPN